MNTHSIPFLWITENVSEQEIENEIKAIKKSGSDMFCVESRVYPDFCEENWWLIMDRVMFTAKSLNMKVWLLDDKHYPTGYANGAILNYSDLKPYQIKCESVDIIGPINNSLLLLNSEKDKRNGDIILYSNDAIERLAFNNYKNDISIENADTKGGFSSNSLFYNEYKLFFILELQYIAIFL